MSRIVSGVNAAELAKDNVLGCFMVDLDFASGHVYLSDGFHATVFNGNTYLALGQFGGIDAVNEELTTLARPLKLTLSGVDAALAIPAETEVYQNRSVVVYSALLNQQTGELVATPEVCWEGRMDYMSIAIDKNVAQITLNCEHRLRREPRISRYSDADQQTAFAGDNFFNYVAAIEGFKASWGNASVSWGGPSYGQGGGGGGRGGGGRGRGGGGG